VRRLVFFILRLAVLIGLVLWLADRPGTARIVWHDYIIDTSAAFLGLCSLALAYVVYLLFRLWHFVRHGPERWRLRRKLKKMKQGHDRLTEGLVAVAGGDATEAGRLAVQARKLLGPTTLTHLLQAQAAQLAGDHMSAKEIFRTLSADNDTATLGYRGLITHARREGDWDEVHALAEKLAEVQPDVPWLNLVRFELLARRKEWDAADAALSQVTAAGLIEPRYSRRHRAALNLAASQNAATLGDHDEALGLAEKAVKQAPNWLPAIINLAQRQMDSDHRRAALRTVERAWKTTPHPQLALLYRVGRDPIDAYKDVERLARDNPSSPDSRLALAEAALAADIWGESRRHLLALMGRDDATRSAFQLMAKLERRESGNEHAAMQWLAKAVEAAPDPVWLCSTCGGAHLEWQPLCAHCSSFDTLEWQSPGRSRRGATPLPLLPQGLID
jgi:HemY protein